MTTWNEFAAAVAELAEFMRSRFTKSIAYLATIRADGSPRVHPVLVHFVDGELFVYMSPASPKAADLQRDARYALHCTVENVSGGNGEASVSGQAAIVTDPGVRMKVFDAARANGYKPDDEYLLFRLTIQRAASTTYHGGQVERSQWKA